MKKNKKDKAKQIHKQIGRLNCPSEKIIEDKTKYNRKTKHILNEGNEEITEDE